jgi:hypothetical protein
MRELSFIPSSPLALATLNKHNTNTTLIRSLCAGAFNPQLARIDFPDKKFAPSVSGAVELDPEAKTIKYFNQENGRVFVHPSSTVFDAQNFPGNSVYMSYFNKMATSKVFIRDLTRRNPQIAHTSWFLFTDINGVNSIQRIYCSSLLRPYYARYTWSWFDRRRLAAATWLGTYRRVD